MATFVTTIRSPLPAEEAFAYMANLSNFEEWDPGVVSAEQVTGNGPGLGAEYDVEVEGIVGTLTLRYRLTSHEPPRWVVAEAETSWLRSLDRITVEPAGDGGSLVTYDAELTLNGPLKLADPLLALAFERIGRRAEQGLVDALQGQTVDNSSGRSR